MRDLIRELIPHAPELGLFVVPEIPPDRLRNAVRDYAPGVALEDVIALYDATLLRNAKDGAVFTQTGFTFQNNDLESPQTIDYTDIVSVEAEKKMLGGRRVHVAVNRGRATIDLVMDFSGRPGAARHVVEFLSEAMMAGVTLRSEIGAEPAEVVETDLAAVRATLRKLHGERVLSSADLRRLLDALG